MFNQLLNLLERYYVYLHLCLLRCTVSKILKFVMPNFIVDEKF